MKAWFETLWYLLTHYPIPSIIVLLGIVWSMFVKNKKNGSWTANSFNSEMTGSQLESSTKKSLEKRGIDSIKSMSSNDFADVESDSWKISFFKFKK